MSWSATAEHERFDVAVEWFRARVPVTKDEVSLLREEDRRRAWMIAGVTELEVTKTVHAELLAAIESGEPFESWRDRVTAKLGGDWLVSDARLETTFRTNVQTAYNAGRWYELADPDVRRVRPFLQYDAVLDSRTTELCRGLDGTIKPQGDPFLDRYWPPLHHRCRGGWRALRASQAEKLGGVTSTPPEHEPSKGFGASPAARADGYTGPTQESYGADLWSAWQAKAPEYEQLSLFNVIEETEKKALLSPDDWLETYRHYGEAGPALAWGRAMHERGLELSIDEVKATVAGVVKAGAAASWGEEFSVVADVAPEAKNVRELAEKVRALAQQLEGASAVASALESIGSVAAHIRAITPAAAVKIPAPRIPDGLRKESVRRHVAHVAVVLATLCDVGIVHPTAKTLSVSWVSRGRAYYADKTPSGKSKIAAYSANSLAHEWGHAIEARNVRIQAAARDFLRVRTLGESERRLRDLTGLLHFGPHEVARPDGFFDPYVGKIYSSGDTEVISMALERVVGGDVVDFGADPEHLWLLLGALSPRMMNP